MIPIVVFAGVGIVFTCLFYLVKIIERLLFNLFRRMEARKIAEIGEGGLRALRRKHRIERVIVPYTLLWALLSLFTGLPMATFISLRIRGLYFSEEGLESDPVVFGVILLTGLVMPFAGGMVYARLFVGKKGKTKALRYLFQPKKLPGMLSRLWYRTCGISSSDIHEYLEEKSG
jgi:hypothetical protein